MLSSSPVTPVDIALPTAPADCVDAGAPADVLVGTDPAVLVGEDPAVLAGEDSAVLAGEDSTVLAEPVAFEHLTSEEILKLLDKVKSAHCQKVVEIS
ncbi:hypothetical protein D9615_005203 [Tricholomella constricta]|uniref:Uncharacterized protein n=1 Tax=Tricholomella constricta TaxID=117010 RepID=A0A8H5H6Z1_9AGAR|nr:hypothetical protein D9615_005203 [Tricholomella constricta]